MIVREFLTWWGINVDDKGVEKFEKGIERARKKADATGDALANMYDKPRNALGQFVKYKDSLFSGGSGKLLGGYVESINLIKEAAADAKRELMLLSGAFAVGAVGLGAFFKLAGDFEQTETAFEVLIGDADKARQKIAELQQFAASTPFNFANVADLSKRLMAYEVTADELIPTMTILGNIAAGVGKDKLPQLVLAFGQVKSATRLTGAELRQFTEAGVPLISELAKHFGTTSAEIKKMVENGKVGFKDVEKALQNLTGEGGRLNNMMQRQAGTLLGMFSNLVDNLQILAIEVGKRGLLGKAKEFLTGMIRFLETNRKQIIDNLQYAVELLIEGMAGLIALGKGAWNVFSGLAQAVGGTRKALEILGKTLLFLAGARMFFLLGKLSIGIAGVAKAVLGIGNAALITQVKIAWWAIMVGAAIAGLALIIEDVVGYFQGKKSLIGMILGDPKGITAAFDKLLDPIFSKLKGFGQDLGKSVIEGIKALSDADWKNIGTGMITALELILNVSSIPVRLGMAIAEGIVDGMIAGIQKNFPKLAAFLGIEDIVTKTGGVNKAAAGDAQTQAMRNMSWSDMLFSSMGFGNKDQRAQFDTAFPTKKPSGGFATEGEKEAWKQIWQMLTLMTAKSGPVWDKAYPPPVPKVPGAGGAGMTIGTLNQNLSIPPGMPTEQAQQMLDKSNKKTWDGVIRETSRAGSPAVDY